MGRRYYTDTPAERFDVLSRVRAFLVGESAKYDDYENDWCWEMARCLEEMMLDIGDAHDIHVDESTLYFTHDN